MSAVKNTYGMVPGLRERTSASRGRQHDTATEIDADVDAWHAASYYFNVVGDSMRDAVILDGEKVLVDRSVALRDRHMVIAVIDSEYTLKRLSIELGIVELRAANSACKPIRLAEGQELAWRAAKNQFGILFAEGFTAHLPANGRIQFSL